MESLIGSLGALGLDVRAEFSKSGRTARIQFRDVPSKWDAEKARTRYAGRRARGVYPPAGSIFNSGTPCRDFLEWQEAHTAAEGMEALGLPRTTYYRKLRKIREKAEEQDRVNASRDKSPEWEGKPRIVMTLADAR